MITSADALPDGSALSADLAVVGAGPADITIVLEAASKGVDVVLIESGHEKLKPNTQQLAEAVEWTHQHYAYGRRS